MKALLCFVHPNTDLKFPPGYWDDVERMDDLFCPRDYCQWMTREQYEASHLCEKAGMKDLDRALHQVRVGYVSYVEEKDGPSEFMRWFKQVVEQRALEATWHEEQAAKKRSEP